MKYCSSFLSSNGLCVKSISRINGGVTVNYGYTWNQLWGPLCISTKLGFLRLQLEAREDEQG